MTSTQILALPVQVNSRLLKASDNGFFYAIEVGESGADAKIVSTDNEAVNLAIQEDQEATMRKLTLNSYNSTVQPTSKLWRLVHKANKTRNGPLRFRSVVLGDSVAADISDHSKAAFGYGGRSVPIVAWTPEGVGVVDTYDQYTRTLKGTIRTLDSSISGGTYCERVGSDMLQNPINSLNVHYLASSGKGKFRLDYKVNGAGSWIAVTTATVSSGGGSVTSGVIDTNNGGAEVYSEARFALPRMDYYHLRLVAVSDGPVLLCYTCFNAGAFASGAASGYGILGGSVSMDFAEGGRSLSSHFSNWNQGVLNQAFSFCDPHVIIYKSANSYGLASYETHWPATAEKIMTAAPDSLLVVCGSHPQNAIRGNLNPDPLAVDDYLREWCANTEGAIFVDVRQNFPDFQDGYADNSGLIDDLWSDGVHIYGIGSYWVSTLVWNAIEPAIEAILKYTSSTEYGRVFPYPAQEIRLYETIKTSSNTASLLSITREPRTVGKVVLRSPSAFFNGGSFLFSDECGFGQSSDSDAASRNSLFLINKSRVVMQFGEHASVESGYLGCILGTNTAQFARAKNGFRVLAPTQVYGANPAMVVEGISTMTAGNTIFAISQGATESAAGTNIFTWHHGGDRRVPKTITAVATTGNQTIDKVAGRVNFAAAAASLTVTNNLVTANSIITVTKATNDSTARLGAVVAGAGSFVIHMDVAPAAECAVNFMIEN